MDFVHLRKAFNRRSGRTLFGYGEGQGENAIRQALSELMICPMLHLPDVSKAADALLIFINGGPGMGMNALQQASHEIREAFKAGEHVVLVPMWTKTWETAFKLLSWVLRTWKQV